MKTIKVNTNPAYEVYIDNDILNSLSSIMETNKIERNRKILVITDSNVEKIYLKQIKEHISSCKYNCDSFVIDAGEENKNLHTVEDILRYLANNNYQRKDVLLALGGGVIGDIVGLCASLYMRGMGYIQIPTTLLSAIDASIGGKTAVDLPEGKNLVGTFYQPKFVLCDLNILKDLPLDIYNEGLAEVIKYGIIKDSSILKLVINSKDNLEEIISKCISIKSEIVSSDEKDNGIRRILNFGHTFAHAIEKCSNYSISHGKAVAEGLIFETKLSCNLNKCSDQFFKEVKDIIDTYFNVKTNYSFDNLAETMKNDKKNNSDKITFVLVDGKENTFIEEVNINEIYKAYIEIYE